METPFTPKYTFDEIPLRLRDNTVKEPVLLGQVLEDPDTARVYGLSHIVIGYDPAKNGSPWPRGCANNCLSCYYDDDFIWKNLPPYISAVLPATPTNLIEQLHLMMGTIDDRMSVVHGRPLTDSDRVFRLSGDIRGDPVMADYQNSKNIIHLLKQAFPNIRVIVDTVANQFAMASELWKDLGADIIMLSLNAVNEAAYRSFHRVGKGRFENAINNIRNIDSAGLQVGLSFVWGYHPRLSDEKLLDMPRYVREGQDPEAIKKFVRDLELVKPPLFRYWFFDMGSEHIKQRILDGNIRYLLLTDPDFPQVERAFHFRYD